jgi:large conductance mechanosensitive channel
VVKFAIIAFVLFLVVKAINTLKRKDVPAPAAPAVPTKEEVLLAEIRDAIQAQARA